MDLVASLYYGTICAALSWGVGRLAGALERVVLGAVVGLIAAVSLPPLRQLLFGG